MNDFFNTGMWERAWREESDSKINRMKQNGIDPTRSFDDKAKSFNEQSFSEEGRQRTKRIIQWLEGRGVEFNNGSVLDIGAASGVFTLPFMERGAIVTAVETSPPLIQLLKDNISPFPDEQASIVSVPFEQINVEAMGWEKAFDLVFVSMSPVIHHWESVEKVLQCARKYCYISMPITPTEHSLVQEIWPLITGHAYEVKHMDMGYLLHLLYLKGYAYETLVSREEKSKEVSSEEALQEAMTWLRHHRLPVDERNRCMIADYLEQAYPSGKVTIREGGRFGKVIIRLQNQNMYM